MKETIIDAIKNRRSVRNFEDKPIPEDLMSSVLEAARWTPSWANTQCWQIVVITDPEIKQKVQEAVPKSNPAFKSIVNAPVVLALCAKLKSSGFYKEQVTTKFGDWFMFDMGLITQTIALAAHASGLGTVVVGLYDHEKAAEVIRVPAGHELVTLMPMGYPAKVPSAPKRREVEDLVIRNTF